MSPTEWPVLEVMFHLKPNWDSYGAPPISEASIAGATTLLHALRSMGVPPPHYVPTSRGGVLLEWHQNGVDLEIEFSTTGEVNVILRHLEPDRIWQTG